MTLATQTKKEKPLRRTYAEQKRYDKFGLDKFSWRVWFEYYDHSGELKMLTITKDLKCKDDCIKLIASLDTQQKNQIGIFAPPEPTKPEVLTFKSYVEKSYFPELLNSTMKSAHSGKKSEIKLMLEYFDTHYGDIALSAIDEDICLKFKKHIEALPVRRTHKVAKKVFNPMTKRFKTEYDFEVRETPRAVSTSNHYLKRLQAIVGKAYRKKKITERVDFENYIDTANEAKREVVISFEHHHALLDACKGVRSHLRLILCALFECGGRLCEIKGITKKDVNLDTQFAYALNSKRRKRSKPTYRKIYISNYLKNALLESGFENLADDDFVFVQGNHKNAWKVAKRDALKSLTASEKKLFDSSLTMKDLRHTAYSNYLQAGVNETIADRQIAHSLSEKITRKVYGNNLSDDYVFAEFQKYERYSEEMRRKADIAF